MVRQKTELDVGDLERALIMLASAMPDRMSLRQAVAFAMIARASLKSDKRRINRIGITVAEIRAKSPVGQAITRSIWTLEHSLWIEKCNGSSEERDQPYRLTKSGKTLWLTVLAGRKP